MNFIKKHKTICIFGCFALVLALAAVVLFGVNRFTLEVKPNGETEITVKHSESYTDAGAEVLIRGTLFFRNGFSAPVNVHTFGTVDTAKPGVYPISYEVHFLGLTGRAGRTVHVVDTTAPVIQLEGDAELSLYVGDEYAEPGCTAWDACDGDLTDAIQVARTGDVISYTVTDAAGNSATVQRRIVWNLPPTPRILLEGGDVITMNAGQFYEEPGYSVAYAGEQDLTGAVTVSGEVLFYLPGTYELTYQVTDEQGNTDTAVRTVVVSAVPQPETVVPEGKVIYLTFDDGPSTYTPELLRLLAKYDVKATFFVVNNQNRHLMKEIVDGGHSIGIHSCTHRYEWIYASEEAYFEDILTLQQIIYDETGVWTTLVRFPGGSSNTASRFNKGIMTRLTQALTDAGFQYFDWNVDSCDASHAKTSEDIYQFILYGAMQQDISIVLQHDTTLYSINAVERVIQWGLRHGYTFLPLDPTSPAVHSRLRN